MPPGCLSKLHYPLPMRALGAALRVLLHTVLSLASIGLELDSTLSLTQEETALLTTCFGVANSREQLGYRVTGSSVFV